MGSAAARQRGSGAALTAPLPSWHFWFDETPRPGWANMAIDQTLLERADQLGECWLRLYRWAPHCLSFGRHEPAALRYDRHRIEAMGLDTVRRPTGGRAVWHAEELTYAVAAPSAQFGSLGAAYQEIHGMLADALSQLGAPVYLAPSTRTPALDAGACFSQPAGGEIMMAGRKVVGSAQLRSGDALLQHGSILLQDNQGVVLSVTSGKRPVDYFPPAAEPWAQGGDIAQAISTAATLRWQGTWDRVDDQSAVLTRASSHFGQYRSVAWTWVR